MSKHTKLLMLELDYELNDEEKKGLESTSLLTRNLINNAYQLNNQTMGAKMSRQWRSVRRLLHEAVEDTKVGFVILSSSDFDSVYDEVYKCKYNAGLARLAPYLYDELDIVKNRSIEEEEKVQREMTMLKEVAEDIKKEPLSKEEKKVVAEQLKEIVAAK